MTRGWGWHPRRLLLGLGFADRARPGDGGLAPEQVKLLNVVSRPKYFTGLMMPGMGCGLRQACSGVASLPAATHCCRRNNRDRV